MFRTDSAHTWEKTPALEQQPASCNLSECLHFCFFGMFVDVLFLLLLFRICWCYPKFNVARVEVIRRSTDSRPTTPTPSFSREMTKRDLWRIQLYNHAHEQSLTLQFIQRVHCVFVFCLSLTRTLLLHFSYRHDNLACTYDLPIYMITIWTTTLQSRRSFKQ
jgi:hypothetical protein